jgi:membrane protease subunit (stomatin/prohibitin family)
MNPLFPSRYRIYPNYQDQFGDIYGPGTHTLMTNNIPILSTLKGWKYGINGAREVETPAAVW